MSDETAADAIGDDAVGVEESTFAHLLDMFDDVYEDPFFKVWDDPNAVPHAHDTSTYLKINFRLHIYFCCRKIRKAIRT